MYLPYAICFTFFAFAGLGLSGLVSFTMFLRLVGVSACGLLCVLVLDAAFMRPHGAPRPQWNRHIVATARETLREGDTCDVDTLTRTITRIAS